MPTKAKEDLLTSRWLHQSATSSDDRQAFTALFEHFYQDLYRFSFYYTKSRELAEEVVSEVFLKVWRQRKSLSTVGNFRSYLFKATKHQSLNQLRKRQPDVSLSEFDQVEVWAVEEANPEAELILLEMQRCIETAIANLPPQCRHIFKLIRQEGLSYKETAQQMGISIKTVEAQLCIAVKKLTHELEHHLPSFRSTPIVLLMLLTWLGCFL